MPYCTVDCKLGSASVSWFTKVLPTSCHSCHFLHVRPSLRVFFLRADFFPQKNYLCDAPARWKGLYLRVFDLFITAAEQWVFSSFGMSSFNLPYAYSSSVLVRVEVRMFESSYAGSAHSPATYGRAITCDAILRYFAAILASCMPADRPSPTFRCSPPLERGGACGKFRAMADGARDVACEMRNTKPCETQTLNAKPCA